MSSLKDWKFPVDKISNPPDLFRCEKCGKDAKCLYFDRVLRLWICDECEFGKMGEID